MGFMSVDCMVHDKNLHVSGRAALLRRPRIQGRAAALPYQESEDFRPAPWIIQNNDLCYRAGIGKKQP
jgi:hypothetical protein